MRELFVINTESIPIPEGSDIDESIKTFIKACFTLKSGGIKSALIDETVGNLHNMEIAPEFRLSRWIENTQSRPDLIEEIRAIRSIAINTPLIDAESNERPMDVYLGSNSSRTLKAAYLYGVPIVSFSTPPWETTPIRATASKITAEATDVTEEIIEIENIVSEATAAHYADKFKRIALESISSGRELLNNVENLYPNLKFCTGATEQLKNWSAGSICLEQVKESFSALNRFAHKWTHGEYSDYSHDALKETGLNHRVSGESESCMSNRRKVRNRSFFISKEKKVTFENHIKIAFGYRIYFYCDHENKEVHIGYLGVHM